MVLASSMTVTTFSTPVEQNTVELINERLDSWNITITSVIDYFTEIARCEQVLSRSHGKLASTLAHSVSTGTNSGSSSPRSEHGGRSNFWLGPLQAFSLQSASGAESLHKYAKEETLVQMERLREEFNSRSKDIKDRLGKLQRSLGKEQEGVVKAMKEHERLWTIRLEKTAVQAQALGQTPDSTAASTPGELKDVWLSELHLHGLIESFLEEKRKYCQVLSDLYGECRLLNADCSRKLVETIAEHFTVKSKQFLAQVELMKDVTRGIEAVEPEVEWQSALTRARLDYEWKLEAPPIDGFTHSILNQISIAIYGAAISSDGKGERSSMAASPLAKAPSSSIAVKPVRIVKSGYLMRPGPTFGPAWQVFFCVLTDSHHLHLYQPETKKKSRRPSGASPELVYHVPSVDEQLSQRHLADLNMAISTAWLGFMKASSSSSSNASPNEWLRIDSRLLDPSLSIPLFEGVSVTVESPNEHIWSIQVPGSGSFFGRSEKKYQLKSFLEEDMVDWCIALKNQIAESQAAPTAFFEAQRRRDSSAGGVKSSSGNLAQAQWTSNDAISNEPDQGIRPSFPSPFDDEDNADDGDDEELRVSSALSGLSLGPKSMELPQKTFNLENPWDE